MSKAFVITENNECGNWEGISACEGETRVLFVSLTRETVETKVAELDEVGKPQQLAYEEYEAGVATLRASDEYTARYDANGVPNNNANKRWYNALEALARNAAHKHGVPYRNGDFYLLPYTSPYNIEELELIENQQPNSYAVEVNAI